MTKRYREMHLYAVAIPVAIEFFMGYEIILQNDAMKITPWASMPR